MTSVKYRYVNNPLKYRNKAFVLCYFCTLETAVAVMLQDEKLIIAFLLVQQVIQEAQRLQSFNVTLCATEPGGLAFYSELIY